MLPQRYPLEFVAEVRKLGESLSTIDQQSELFRRHLGFTLFLVGTVIVFWTFLQSLLRYSLTNDIATHMILVVPVSAYLFYLKRKQIFSNVRTGIVPGSLLFLSAVILWWLDKQHVIFLELDGELSLVMLAIVILWMSGFIFFYGPHAFVKGCFPLLFLLFLVPIPALLIEKITFFLQSGSATVAFGMLKLFSVPVLKQGFVMHLPTLDIEVAKQCSGIRSSLILFITTLLMGQFALRSAWRKLLLILCVVPILIFKNAARIVALSLLSIYVDRGFLHGWLHTSGGILFYMLGLAILIPIVVAFRNSERGKIAARQLQPLPPVL